MRESADGIDVSNRLPDLRRAILTDGIHADEMGMVSLSFPRLSIFRGMRVNHNCAYG